MIWVILHSNIANGNELIDPYSDFGEDISENDGILVSTSWYRPLLIYTFLSPPFNRLENIVNFAGGVKVHGSPILLLEP